jgi:hypothetical protein
MDRDQQGRKIRLFKKSMMQKEMLFGIDTSRRNGFSYAHHR